MADISTPPKKRFPKIEGAWIVSALLILGTAIFVPNDLRSILDSAAGNILHTSMFIAFAVFLIAYLKATGAESYKSATMAFLS